MRRFGILGPIEVYDQYASPVPAGGPRQVRLLGFFLIHANEAVSADRLRDVLWGAERPRGTDKRVHVAVSRLRKALPAGADGSPLHTVAGGYRLAVGSGDLDAQAFEAAVGEGRRALEQGQAGRASDVLDKALNLWRGPPLADVAYEDWAQLEARRLDDLRLDALQAGFEARLRLGRHDTVVGELEASVRRHPDREHLAGLLMAALYRCGRQGDALAVYQRSRRYLAAELGLEPGPVLTRLQAEILARQPLSWPSMQPDAARSMTGLASESAGPPPADGSPAPAPLPAALRALAARPFVGRRVEIRSLRDYWHRAVRGGPVTSFVAGEPGMGKTVLAAHLARFAHDQGATVLYGRCDEHAVRPYQPLAEALEGYWREQSEPISSQTVAPDIAEIGRIVPMLSPYLPPTQLPVASEPDTQRYRLFEAVSAMLRQAGGDRPLLLALDDLHWADRSSLLLIRHVLREHDFGLLLLGTYRQHEAQPALVELLADVERSVPLMTVQLEAFGERESAELIAAHLDALPAEETAATWHRRTEGHPFFLSEMLRKMQPDALAVAAPSDLPRTVREMILRRVRRLDPSAASTLAIAAVIGREFGLGVLEAVAGDAATSPLAAVEEAMAAGLVVEVPERADRFAFSHALVQETMYVQHSRSTRARIHDRIARALEAGGSGTPAELARHAFAARGVGGHQAAVRHGALAARAAADARAYDEAAEFYRQALEALAAAGQETQERFGELLLALATVEWRAGDARAESTFERAAASARDRGDAVQLARAALSGRHYESGHPDERRVAALTEALNALGDTNDPLRIRVVGRLAEALYFVGQTEQALQLSCDAVSAARELDDPEALIAASIARHVALMNVEHLDARLDVLRELRALAASTGHADLVAHAAQWTLYGCLERGDNRAIQVAYEHFTRVARDLHEPGYEHLALAWDTMFAHLHGRLDEAERLAGAAYALAPRVVGLDALELFAGQLFFIRRDQHRLPELLPSIAGYVHSNQLAAWRAAFTLALIADEDLERARHSFELSAAGEFDDIPRDLWWLSAMVMLAESAALLRDRVRAERIYALLSPYADRSAQLAFAIHLGSVHHYLGLLASAMDRPSVAAEHYEKALERHVAMSARTLAERTRAAMVRGSP